MPRLKIRLKDGRASGPGLNYGVYGTATGGNS